MSFSLRIRKVFTLITFASGFALLSGTNASAMDPDRDAALRNNELYFQIDPSSIKIEDVAEASPKPPTRAHRRFQLHIDHAAAVQQNLDAPEPSVAAISDEIGPLAEISAWVDGLIGLGKKFWPLIEAGKAVANIETQRFSVAVDGVKSWKEMSGWQAPVSRAFTVSASNKLGMKVVSYTYQVSFNPGGSFQNRGQYIANLTIVPKDISVAWGFTLNSNVEIEDVVNTGTTNDPIPGVTARVHWKMDSIFMHLEGSQAFFARGDGSLTPN